MENRKRIMRVIIILLVVGMTIMIGMNQIKTSKNLPVTQNVSVVPTMLDELTSDSTWCGTFQLVWNDMKREVAKQDVVFTPQEKMAENLNLEDFTTEMLSEEYYYKNYGLKTLELKEEIEKGIKKKFNQTSDILKDFDWSEEELNNADNPDVRRYFFYVMLYREFEFLKKFDTLEIGSFGDKYENVEYFGIDAKTDEEVAKQIQVLYYHSQEDFAVLIETKEKDEVIFCKSPEGNNFKEIYENMNKKADNYKGKKRLQEMDEFKAPKIDINLKREYQELQNKIFKTADPVYDTAEIVKAIQTIQFSLDEKGGKIKSEAGMDVTNESAAFVPEDEEPRFFYVNDTFAIFLREEGRKLPYFAGRIEDITKFQS